MFEIKKKRNQTHHTKPLLRLAKPLYPHSVTAFSTLISFSNVNVELMMICLFLCGICFPSFSTMLSKFIFSLKPFSGYSDT